MKRDMDIVRQLLLRAEAAGGQTSVSGALETYHVRLMIDAGLVDGCISEDVTSDAPQHSWIDGLTWSGHDFLDAARDEGLWQKARDKFLKPAGSWTSSLLLEWLKDQIRSGLAGA